MGEGGEKKRREGEKETETEMGTVRATDYWFVTPCQMHTSHEGESEKGVGRGRGRQKERAGLFDSCCI